MEPKKCDHKFVDSDVCLKCGWDAREIRDRIRAAVALAPKVPFIIEGVGYERVGEHESGEHDGELDIRREITAAVGDASAFVRSLTPDDFERVRLARLEGMTQPFDWFSATAPISRPIRWEDVTVTKEEADALFATNERLVTENAELKQRIAALEQRLGELEAFATLHRIPVVSVKDRSEGQS